MWSIYFRGEKQKDKLKKENIAINYMKNDSSNDINA